MRLFALGFLYCIRSLIETSRLRLMSHPVLYPSKIITRDGPFRPFGENQLSPGSIGILPLSTSHPMLLQQQRVRASIPLSRDFTLLMDRSPGFGPTTVYKVGLFTLAFTTPPQQSCLSKVHNDYSPVHSSIGTRSPQSYDGALSVCSQTVSGSISLSVSLIF